MLFVNKNITIIKISFLCILLIALLWMSLAVIIPVSLIPSLFIFGVFSGNFPDNNAKNPRQHQQWIRLN